MKEIVMVVIPRRWSDNGGWFLSIIKEAMGERAKAIEVIHGEWDEDDIFVVGEVAPAVGDGPIWNNWPVDLFYASIKSSLTVLSVLFDTKLDFSPHYRTTAQTIHDGTDWARTW
jgi:hypothetical protein